MFVRRTVIAAALIAVPLAFAASAQAAPATCSGGYFAPDQNKSICGAPNISKSIGNAMTNLHENFNPHTAAGNLEHAITHGVGEQDKNAP